MLAAPGIRQRDMKLAGSRIHSAVTMVTRVEPRLGARHHSKVIIRITCHILPNVRMGVEKLLQIRIIGKIPRTVDQFGFAAQLLRDLRMTQLKLIPRFIPLHGDIGGIGTARYDHRIAG